jgi:hypothetical protein
VKIVDMFTVSSVSASEFLNANGGCMAVLGDGGAPDPTPVDAGARDAGPRDGGSTTADAGASASGPKFNGFELTGSGGKVLAVGLNFYNSNDYCLYDMCFAPTCTVPAGRSGDMKYRQIAMGQMVTTVQGIVDTDAHAKPDMSFLKISPVTNEDLVRQGL